MPYLRTTHLFRRTLITTLLLLAPLLSSAAAKPQVVASIHPVALLLAEVAGDEVEVRTLVDSGQTPHSFQMRPSDRRMLARADLIFWVGPRLELFLQGLMNQPGLEPKSIALQQEIGLTGESESSAHQEPGHSHPASSLEHEHHAAHDHHGEHNPHIWLDPGQALEIASAIAVALRELEGVDSAAIERNLEDFKARLQETDESLHQALEAEPEPQANLFTYHEAYGAFAEHYGLEMSGSLTLSPEIQPGARRLAAILDKFGAAGSPCLLVEPQFNSEQWRRVIGDDTLRISSWDPLGTEIEARPGGYNRFLEQMVQAVLDCQTNP